MIGPDNTLNHRFSPAQREVLLALVGQVPRLAPRQVAAEFLARTGRSVSPEHARDVRRRHSPGPAVEDAPAPVGPPPHFLTEAERRVLLDLIRTNPGATVAALRRRFEARAGRPVSESTVRRAWVRGYRPDNPARPLTGGQRDALMELCHAAAPHFNRTELARRFYEATGRRIKRTTVDRCLRAHFGVVGPGRPGRPPRKAVAPC